MPTYRCPVRLDFDGPGQPAYNIWHFRTGSSITTDAPERAGAIGALNTFYTSVRGLLATGVTIRVPFDLVDIGKEPPESSSFTSSAITSTGTTEAPPMLSLCVSWKTQVRTRSGRGRTFLGPLPYNTVDSGDGTPTSAALTTLRTAAQALVDSSLTDNGWAIGVYSRTDLVIRDIVSMSVTDQFAVMRSRRD